MNSTNNERLRILVRRAGVSEAVALTLFNRGLGSAAYTLENWKALFVDPSSERYRLLSDELLAHAEKVFATDKA